MTYINLMIILCRSKVRTVKCSSNQYMLQYTSSNQWYQIILWQINIRRTESQSLHIYATSLLYIQKQMLFILIRGITQTAVSSGTRTRRTYPPSHVSPVTHGSLHSYVHTAAPKANPKLRQCREYMCSLMQQWL